MANRSLLIGGCIGLIAIGASYLQIATAQSQRTAPAASQPVSSPAPKPAALPAVVRGYCVACHNGKMKTAGLELDSLYLAHLGNQDETWEKVASKLRTREMPP